jgi:hypothetical protein
MKTTYWLAVLALVAAAPAGAQDNEELEAAAEERYGHLEKGKSGFRETWVNPDTNWTYFDKLYLWEAEFQYRDVGPARRFRSTMMNTRQREFGISDTDRAKFEEVVSEIFVEEIRKAKNFAIVDEPRPEHDHPSRRRARYRLERSAAVGWPVRHLSRQYGRSNASARAHRRIERPGRRCRCRAARLLALGQHRRLNGSGELCYGLRRGTAVGASRSDYAPDRARKGNCRAVGLHQLGRTLRGRQRPLHLPGSGRCFWHARASASAHYSTAATSSSTPSVGDEVTSAIMMPAASASPVNSASEPHT